VRALVLIPISSLSLIHQWYNTRAGHTGNARSDVHERTMKFRGTADLEDPEERVRVSIISAKGLRRADLTGSSDPYCVCQVAGKPHIMFKTQYINKTLAPVWNETQELPGYRRHDDIKFDIWDHDDDPALSCCDFWAGDDHLGDVTLKSADVHPNGFAGELHLAHAGRFSKDASITVKVPTAAPEEVDPTADVTPTALGAQAVEAGKSGKSLIIKL